MPPKADKLSQTIESLQLFLAKKAEEREDLGDIARQLTQLNKTLRHKKLTVQIVSTESALAQGVFDLISEKTELKEAFQLKFDKIPSLPQQSTPQQTASLKLKQMLGSATELRQHLELNSQQEYTIGRCPTADITIDSQLYQGVSWDHAAVQKVAGTENQWQICDRHSTNGTFVNGQRVIDTQLLNSGDTITLACPQKGEMVAELAFNVRVENPDTAVDREYWEVVDCDLLLVVADGKQPLATEVKEFITNLDRTYISQSYLLLDTPDPKQEPELGKIADKNLKEIEAYLKNELKAGWELVPLYLKPFYDEDFKANVDPRQQKKQERFSKTLGNLVKRQPENILAKRIAVKIVRAAEPIEPLLQQQQQELTQKLEQEQQELTALSKTNIKEISKKAIAEAHQDKDKFFKQVKLDIAQSKAALLDIYSKKSVNYKIQDFVEKLTPVVSNKNGQKIIQLKDESKPNLDDINISLVKFCTKSLETWTNEEWFKICHEYNQGGLKSLLERIYQTINIIPDVASESLFSPPKDINVQDNFLVSFAGTNCETTHKQKSLGAYVMKQLRSQMMQVMMMLTLVLGFVGINANRGQMMKSLSGSFQKYPWLFGFFVCGVIFLLVNAYNNDNKIKLEEAGTKLKKDLGNYYQSFTKNLLEKVIQDINLSLETEDKKIVNSLEIVSDAYSDRILEIEKKQVQIKNNLEKYREQQKSLDKELAEFEKLKKM